MGIDVNDCVDNGAALACLGFPYEEPVLFAGYSGNLVARLGQKGKKLLE